MITMMNRNLRKLFLIILYSLITSCLSAQYLIYSDSIPVQHIRVPLPYLKGGTIQDNITDIQYFPLEIKEKADIINRVSDIVANAHTIALYSNLFAKNSVSSSFYMYGGDGNLKHRFSTINDFKSSTINEIKPCDDGFIIRTGDSAIQIDTMGEWKKSPNPLNDLSDSVYMDKTTSWYYQSFRQRESGPIKVGLYKNNIPYISYITGSKPNLLYDLDKPFSPYAKRENTAYSTFPFSTDVFELSDKEIRNVYRFIFPLDYTLDTAQYRLVNDEEGKKAFDWKHPHTIHGFDNVIRYRNYLILQLKYLKGDSQWIALNLNTNDIVDLESLLPDPSSDYMPIIGAHKRLISNGEYLYSILYPNEIVDQNEEKGSRPITDRARSLSKSKNPILVRFKLK